MSITVKAARDALEAAQLYYTTCSHAEVTEAKDQLSNARHEYWSACATLVANLEFKTSLDQVESELIAQGLWT